MHNFPRAASSVLILVLATAIIYSNGGPIDESIYHKFGRIEPQSIADVKLTKEALNISIKGNYSDIAALYILTNTNREQDYNISYGFPVDYYNRGDLKEQKNWDTAIVRKMTFRLDGLKLKTKKHTDTKKYSDEYETNNGVNTVEFSRIWYLADIEIPAGSTVILEVSFTLKNNYADYDVLEQCVQKYNDRTIRYDLSPAKSWGDAVIGDFSVNIDAGSIIKNYGTINIKGVTAKESKAGIYTYRSRDFLLNNGSKIIITYDINNQLKSGYVLNHLIPTKNIKVTGSGSLKGNYSAENLIDRNLSTAWAEGTDDTGVGEWVEFELDSCELNAIYILNGYRKSKKTFEENSAPAILLISIETVEGENIVTMADTVVLENSSYIPVNKNNFYKASVKLNDECYGYNSVKSIRITILGIRKGTKFDDTCIAEIFFLGHAKNK